MEVEKQNKKKCCPNCGMQLEKDASFCGECGFDLSSNDLDTTKTNSNSIEGKGLFKSQYSNKKNAIIIGTAVFAISGLLIYSNHLRNQESNYNKKIELLSQQRKENDEELDKYKASLVNSSSKELEDGNKTINSKTSSLEKSIELYDKQLKVVTEKTTSFNQAYEDAKESLNSNDFMVVFNAYENLHNNSMTNDETDFEEVKNQLLSSVETD